VFADSRVDRSELSSGNTEFEVLDVAEVMDL